MVYLYSSELLARLANTFCDPSWEDSECTMVLSDLEDIVCKVFSIQPKERYIHPMEEFISELLRKDRLLTSLLIEYTIFEFKLLDHDGLFVITMEF